MFLPVKAAEEYADSIVDKNLNLTYWEIVRDAWLTGWDMHRLGHPEM